MPDTLLEDVELVGRSAAGDQDAFAELFDRHAPGVLGLLTSIAPSRRAAEETLVEAFVRAWNEIEDYDPGGETPGAWLSTVARLEARKRFGQAEGDAREGMSEGDEPLPIEAPSESARRKTLWRINRQSNTASLPLAIGLGAALFAILLALVAWGTVREEALKRDVDALARARAQDQSSLTLLKKEVRVGRGQVARLQLVARIMGSEDLAAIRLRGLDRDPNASAHVFVDRSSGEAVFFSRGLPPVPSGKIYQLWFVPAGKPVSGGIFSIDREGGAILIIDGVPVNARIQSWRVTLEASGGARQPSGPVVLSS